MGASVKKSTLYLIATVFFLAAFVLGLVQAVGGGGWLQAVIPLTLAAITIALWSRARASERT